MSAQHTPLPWIVAKQNPVPTFWCVGAAEDSAAVCIGAKESDARLMVLAVNHHAALVAALEKMTTWATTYARQSTIDVDRSTGPLASDIDEARALLAKSKPETELFPRA